MDVKGPPAYAWDWFARQRLLWREVRSRLAAGTGPTAVRYAALDARPDVVASLRSDYLRDPAVRATIEAVVAEVAFLDHTDRPFATLGRTNPPRGLRWWWTALTGEELDAPIAGEPAPDPPRQLALDDVAWGYGEASGSTGHPPSGSRGTLGR